MPYVGAAVSGDGVDAALTLTASRCAILVVLKHKLKETASMEEVSIIGVDLAKNVFQLHGAAADVWLFSARSCRDCSLRDS